MASAHSPEGDTPVPTTEIDPPAGQGNSVVTDEEWRAMLNILNIVYDHRTPEGHDPSKVFHKKVNKRLIPDYYEVIKEPIALSVVKVKINQKTYKNFAEFVRDFALIIHNAQVYNRPDAGAYQDAIELKTLLQSELKKLVDANIITESLATLPYLGEIPLQDQIVADEKVGVEEEDEDDEDDNSDGGDESDDSHGGKRKGRNRIRTSLKGKTEEIQKDDISTAADQDPRKRRGRPPRVDTPMEARIKNILKGMRKFKDDEQQAKINNFERLPDRTIMPGYYEEIKTPMAVDVLKKKLKRKKYTSLDQFMLDVDLMFENAKVFNEDDSQIYKDAVELQEGIRELASIEQQKPDSDFVMEDGRLPLPEGILHNGEIYKVGDWVHIQNANDLTKPIVAQIYRTWQDASGQKFVNACWYYRPEQTVHRFDRHFFENEIVKTGQYRDHSVEEIVDRCFVMFVTRYNKGRPRNFPRDKEIYVCEARYNEEKFTLNKIKTWASCLPDEVRDKDYEMELYPEPKKMKKLPSPIAYLLKDEAKETDDLPKPEWGADNAPPKIGAVHKRPRDPKESPPPERTPTPPPEPTPPPPPPVRQMSNNMTHQSDAYPRNSNTFNAATSARQSTMSTTPQLANMLQPQRSFQQPISPSPHLRQLPDNINNNNNTRTPTYPTHTSQSSYNPRQPQPDALASYAQKLAAGVGLGSLGGSGSPSGSAAGSSISNLPPYSLHGGSGSTVGAIGANYKAPQPIEVWSLNDAANASIPPDIREQFQRDEAGRVLFFTAPPLDTEALAAEAAKASAEAAGGSVPLGHSVRYLAGKAERDAKVQEWRKRKAEVAAEGERERRKKAWREREEVERKVEELTGRALSVWGEHMLSLTKAEFELLSGRKLDVFSGARDGTGVGEKGTGKEV